MDNGENPNTPKTPPGADDPAAAPPRKTLFQRFEEHIWGATEESQAGFGVMLKRWLQVLDRAFAGFYRNKCFDTASGLTYTSILTMVPLLAILLAVLKGFGVHQTVHEAIRKLPFIQALKVVAVEQPEPPRRRPAQPGAAETIGETTVQTTPTLPLSIRLANNSTSATTSTRTLLTGEQVADEIFNFVENTDISKLGIIGLLGLLWAVMGLISRIEDAMNAAWAVHRSRTLARKFSDYLNMLAIVLLIVVGLSMTVTAKLSDLTGFLNRVGGKGVGDTVLKTIPYLIVWAAFIFMYYYIPNTRVRLKSAMMSGLLAGTMFQLLQVVFIRTQILVGKYNKIYGVFAIVLILLVWLYLSWCIVLWGAEVCSAHQNLRDWRRRRRLWTGTPAERETLALRVAALLASPLLGHRGKRLDAGDLADKLTLPLEPVGEIIDLFQAHGLLVQSAEDGAYIFTRSPDSVTVLDLLRLVRQGTMDAGPPGGWLHGISLQIQPALQSKTVKDLIGLPVEDIKTFIF